MKKVHENINNYYTKKIARFGPTPKGVDWNGEESQMIRFNELSKIIKKKHFSIADIGCGYGKLYDFLASKYDVYQYIGYDLSEEMISQAKILYNKQNNAQFVHIKDLTETKIVDYCVASGIFSVKMEHHESEWFSYILNTLDALHSKSKHGFAFNMLTKYSDKEYMKENLYYADPLFFFDYCKRNFSRNVALLHDYELYEFTILVRKD